MRLSLRIELVEPFAGFAHPGRPVGKLVLDLLKIADKCHGRDTQAGHSAGSDQAAQLSGEPSHAAREDAGLLRDVLRIA